VIDEPEVSLHPNWQIKYNMHLRKILSNYNNVHVIIATHSHFMVSGLHSEESSIFSIAPNKKIELITDSTYSWSSENILYSVFGVRTVNNYYIEQDLHKVLKLISNSSTNTLEIQSIYQKLKSISYHEHDPLNQVLEKISNYLQSL
jgi:predicted ATP-binding protein involved in virulence